MPGGSCEPASPSVFVFMYPKINHVATSRNPVHSKSLDPLKMAGRDAFRAMLDEMMGANRNGDRPDAVITSFEDDRLCRDYLCGLCTYVMFENTKDDRGRCPKTHNDDMKAA